MKRRGLRLELVAGLGMALAMPWLPAVAANAQAVSTQTALTVETHGQGGQTQANVHVAVTGFDGQPAGGAVVLEDGNRQLAGVSLDSNGEATTALTLTPGAHALRAVYTGDDAHRVSVSPFSNVQAQTPAGTPSFQVSVAPATATLTAGQSANIAVSVTPVNNASLTSPMFVTLSCSNLPNQAACSFTPASVEILSTTSGALTSQMVLQTQAATTSAKAAAPGHPGKTVAWAVLLPGVLGLGGLAWGARRRRWLQRLALVALVALVASLGTTGCSPLYYYYNHGPPAAPATPSGSYTITVTGQSSNGVTAIISSTSVALTVK